MLCRILPACGIVWLALGLGSQALAWEQYGHELTQITATQLLLEQKHPLARAFAANAVALNKVALVPDREWQVDPAKKKVRRVPNPQRFEASMHFFAVDAFVRPDSSPEAVLSLPACGVYQSCAADYARLARANRGFIEEYGPFEEQVHYYGTAPWRALQLYDLAVSALRAKELRQALFYLTALGSYVGDLASPLRTTLNFDGGHYPLPASGAQTAFEKALLERAVDAEGSSFQADIAELAQSTLGPKGLDGLTRERIVPELVKLVHSGYSLVEGILQSYAEQCAKVASRGLASAEDDASARRAPRKLTGAACEPGHLPELNTDFMAGFARGRVKENKERGLPEQSVLEAAARRLASGSVVLARLWAAAFVEAGSPDFKGRPISGFSFADLASDERYPVPAYLKPASK